MKARYIIWAVIIAAISVIIYQNREFYLGEHTLSLNLAIARFETPPISTAMQVLFYFLAGLVPACISMYYDRFRLRQQIGEVNTAFNTCARQVIDQRSTECGTAPKARFEKLKGMLRIKRDGTNTATANTDHSNTVLQLKGPTQ